MAQTPREAARQTFPWAVPAEQQGWTYRTLLDHCDYIATRGRGMEEWKLRRLQDFYDKLEQENLVVEYHPEIPANEAAEAGGFAYRTREDSDGRLIIRVNDVTTLTDAGRIIWRMPPSKPEELA